MAANALIGCFFRDNICHYAAWVGQEVMHGGSNATKHNDTVTVGCFPVGCMDVSSCWEIGSSLHTVMNVTAISCHPSAPRHEKRKCLLRLIVCLLIQQLESGPTKSSIALLPPRWRSHLIPHYLRWRQDRK